MPVSSRDPNSRQCCNTDVVQLPVLGLPQSTQQRLTTGMWSARNIHLQATKAAQKLDTWTLNLSMDLRWFVRSRGIMKVIEAQHLGSPWKSGDVCIGTRRRAGVFGRDISFLWARARHDGQKTTTDPPGPSELLDGAVIRKARVESTISHVPTNIFFLWVFWMEWCAGCACRQSFALSTMRALKSIRKHTLFRRTLFRKILPINRLTGLLFTVRSYASCLACSFGAPSQ